MGTQQLCPQLRAGYCCQLSGNPNTLQSIERPVLSTDRDTDRSLRQNVHLPFARSRSNGCCVGTNGELSRQHLHEASLVNATQPGTPLSASPLTRYWLAPIYAWPGQCWLAPSRLGTENDVQISEADRPAPLPSDAHRQLATNEAGPNASHRRRVEPLAGLYLQAGHMHHTRRHRRAGDQPGRGATSAQLNSRGPLSQLATTASMDGRHELLELIVTLTPPSREHIRHRTQRGSSAADRRPPSPLRTPAARIRDPENVSGRLMPADANAERARLSLDVPERHSAPAVSERAGPETGPEKATSPATTQRVTGNGR
jgi:hypothetical protein